MSAHPLRLLLLFVSLLSTVDALATSGARAKQVIANNKLARRNYEILEDYEAGIALVGTEVKSCRVGKCQLRDGFCRIKDGECWLHNVNIARHSTAGSFFQHDEIRTQRPLPPPWLRRVRVRPSRVWPSPVPSPAGPRRLLLHKREIQKLADAVDRKGLTLVCMLSICHTRDGTACGGAVLTFAIVPERPAGSSLRLLQREVLSEGLDRLGARQKAARQA